MQYPTYPAYPSNEEYPRVCRRAIILSIEKDGFWIRGPEKDYFLSFDLFPWFRYVDDADIHSVDFSSTDYGKYGWVHGFHWNLLDIDIGLELLEQAANGEDIRPRIRLITHSHRRGKLQDRKRNKKSRKKEFNIPVQFIFDGSFTVKAENAEEARRIVEEQCSICCGGVHVDIFKTQPDTIEWNFTETPQKRIL